MPLPARQSSQHHWEVLERMGPDNPWRELLDEFCGDEPEAFQERHYNEFVTFLPYVQRFLYGERPCAGRAPARHGVADARVPPPATSRGARDPLRPGDDAADAVDVAHVDLYFFYDIDVVLLNVEVMRRRPAARAAQDLAVPLRPRLPGGLGRATARRCTAPQRVEWLDAAGEVLATSDSQQRDGSWPSSASTARRASPRTGRSCWSRWCPTTPAQTGHAALPPDRVLPHAADGLPGARRPARADAQRLRPPGPVTGAGGDRRVLPYSPKRTLADFEQRYCYDRFWATAAPAPRRHALPLLRPRAGGGRRRDGAVLRLPRPRRARRSSATSTSCCS